MQDIDNEVKEFIEKYHFNTDDFIMLKNLFNRIKMLTRITQRNKDVSTIVIKSML
jgi:hypothetical protein